MIDDIVKKSYVAPLSSWKEFEDLSRKCSSCQPLPDGISKAIQKLFRLGQSVGMPCGMVGHDMKSLQNARRETLELRDIVCDVVYSRTSVYSPCMT